MGAWTTNSISKRQLSLPGKLIETHPYFGSPINLKSKFIFEEIRLLFITFAYSLRMRQYCQFMMLEIMNQRKLLKELSKHHDYKIFEVLCVELFVRIFNFFTDFVFVFSGHTIMTAD